MLALTSHFPIETHSSAIIITLLIVTTLYCGASVGLAGMVPYQDISETSGFPEGFRYRGYHWAAEITAVSVPTGIDYVCVRSIAILLQSHQLVNQM